MKYVFVVLFMLFALAAQGASFISHIGSRSVKIEESLAIFPDYRYRVSQTHDLILSGNNFSVDAVMYYAEGPILFWTRKELFKRNSNNTDSFICTNATDIYISSRRRGGTYIGTTNVIANYWNDRTYPGGNGTVIVVSGNTRQTINSKTTYKIDNTGDEQTWDVYPKFSIGGGFYVQDKIRIAPNQVIMYTPNIAFLARKAGRKINNLSLVSVDQKYAGRQDFTGKIFLAKREMYYEE